jgi:hypothetical protein
MAVELPRVGQTTIMHFSLALIKRGAQAADL